MKIALFTKDMSFGSSYRWILYQVTLFFSSKNVSKNGIKLMWMIYYECIELCYTISICLFV